MTFKYSKLLITFFILVYVTFFDLTWCLIGREVLITYSQKKKLTKSCFNEISLYVFKKYKKKVMLQISWIVNYYYHLYSLCPIVVFMKFLYMSGSNILNC